MTRWPSPDRRTNRVLVLKAATLVATLAAGTGAAEVPFFDCVIRPQTVVSVGAAVEGVAAEVLVEKGARVTEGELLARIEDRVERASVEVAQLQADDGSALAAQVARLALAEARLARSATLLDRGAVTRESHDELQAELEIGRAELTRLETVRDLRRLELERARAVLSLREIRSPVTGVVIERRVDVGEFVRREVAILEIAEIDPLRVEVFLPADMYGAVSLGMRAAVTPAQPAGVERVAVVSRVDAVFDPSSNTFGTQLRLDDPAGTVPAGQRCELRFLG